MGVFLVFKRNPFSSLHISSLKLPLASLTPRASLGHPWFTTTQASHKSTEDQSLNPKKRRKKGNPTKEFNLAHLASTVAAPPLAKLDVWDSRSSTMATTASCMGRPSSLLKQSTHPSLSLSLSLSLNSLPKTSQNHPHIPLRKKRRRRWENYRRTPPMHLNR